MVIHLARGIPTGGAVDVNAYINPLICPCLIPIAPAVRTAYPSWEDQDVLVPHLTIASTVSLAAAFWQRAGVLRTIVVEVVHVLLADGLLRRFHVEQLLRSLKQIAESRNCSCEGLSDEMHQ